MPQKSQELFIWQVEKTKEEEGGGESFQKVYFSDIIHSNQVVPQLPFSSRIIHLQCNLTTKSIFVYIFCLGVI